MNEIFERSKQLIIEAIREGVRIYDIAKPTCLCLDWSNTGIGYFLTQKHCSCESRVPGCCKGGWRITLAGSRFLKPAESRYAPIEGEALTIAWALEHTRFFTLGCDDLVVITDHKPLVGVFQDKTLNQITNPRLFSLKQATLPWKFSVVHLPGKGNHFADATSRNPVPDPDIDGVQSISLSESLMGIMLHEDNVIEDKLLAIRDNEVRAVTWEIVKQETQSDPLMQKLITLAKTSFPSDRSEMPPELLPYWKVRSHLYVVDDVLLMNDSVVTPPNLRASVSAAEYAGFNVRIIVPQKLRSEIITTLHSAHQGVSGMNERAKVGVYWPGITNDIQMARLTCTSCNNIAPSQARTPPVEPHIPTTPFEAIVCDYFKYIGHYYFVAADRLSGWLELQQVRVGTSDAGAQGLCKALRRLMITFGVPVEVSSDGGPEFIAAETEDFFKRWGIRHHKSSAYFPSSNGRAELAVKTAKRLLMDNVGPSGELDSDALVAAMLTYRNTPEPGCKLSPAQILMGRPLRDTLPCIDKSIMVFNNPDILPQWREAWEAKEEALRTRYTKTLETLDEHSRPLPPLQQEDHVMVQNQTGRFPRRWDKSGTVVETKDNDQYVVKMSGSGRLTLRNRRFLRKCTLPSALINSLPSLSPARLPASVDDTPAPSKQQTSPYISVTPLGAQSSGSGSQLSGDLHPATPPVDQDTLLYPPPVVLDTPTSVPCAPTESDDSSAPHRRVSGRVRTLRTVYDAATGQFTKPASVPEDV